MTNVELGSLRVNGRYMKGSEVVGYNVIAENGATQYISKDKAILLISRGIISNLRVQYSGDDVLIRGKGINLNNLPVYDINKEEIRGNSQLDKEKQKLNGVNPLAQFTLSKRIMYKTSCIGYLVIDASGHQIKLNKSKVIDLGVKGLLTNAEVQKYTPKDSTTPRLVLRGINCNLKKDLQAMVVDQNGNIIDASKPNQELKLRATRMRRGGIIYNQENGNKQPFEPGDYLIVNITGGLRIIKEKDAPGRLKKTLETQSVCDNYLDNLKNYPIELFGASKQLLNPKTVLGWPVVAVTR